MTKSAGDLIDEWFDGRQADGDFVRYDRSVTYSILPPARRGAPIIYSTKTNAIATAMDNDEADADFGFIMRYGLPSRADATAIRRLVGSDELCFLGDLDPSDLMIFAWLRARLRPKRVRFLGISDWYLDRLKAKLPESFTIQLSRSEQRSLPLLRRVLPDVNTLVGEQCGELLARRRKIELEAVVSALGPGKSIVAPALY